MNKKGLFFDMMIAVMMILGILTVIVTLFTSQTGEDQYELFSQNYSFSYDYAKIESLSQAVQREQVKTISTLSLTQSCPEFVHNFDSEEMCYKKILDSFFTQIDISDKVAQLNYSYSFDGNQLQVIGKNAVDFVYTTNKANISLSRPVDFTQTLDSQLSSFLRRIPQLESDFTDRRECVLRQTNCQGSDILISRTIIDVERRLVETIFTDSSTQLKAISVDIVSPTVLESLVS